MRLGGPLKRDDRGKECAGNARLGWIGVGGEKGGDGSGRKGPGSGKEEIRKERSATGWDGEDREERWELVARF